MIHFFVKPASSRCEWRQTRRLPPSPAGLDGGRHRWQGRLLGRFAVEIRLVICSLACRKNLAGEVAHFEIPYSGRAIFSASVHPPSLCLGIENIKLDGIFCVPYLETNYHDVLADAFNGSTIRQIQHWFQMFGKFRQLGRPTAARSARLLTCNISKKGI